MMPLDFEIYLWILGLCVFIFLVDDLLIDLVALFKKLGPKPVAKSVLFDPKEQRKLAIMVANWKEDDVLNAMIHGNMERITQESVHFFLGVYPNDTATYEIVEKLAQKFERVHMVVNRLNGPTYKGQMLNEVIYSIFEKERELGFEFDGFVMHDSEDILDPRLPYLYSLGLRQADFVQTPVLSLPLEMMEFTGGTYLDEFAEIHTKDLLVRQHLGAAVPSAGVGTCLSRKLLLTFLSRQGGEVFLPDSLTEDYQLGLQTAQWGFLSKFMCHYVEGEGPEQLISTREFFPHDFDSSIKQKTRWTTGIAFQGLNNLGWFGNFWQRYFLWRDRKGPVNAFLTLNMLALLILMPLLDISPFKISAGLNAIFAFNSLGMIFRFGVRFHCVQRIFGSLMAFGVFVRWPVAMLINMSAGLRSTHQYLESSVTGEKIKWSKTQHRLPVGFGSNVPIPIQQQKVQTSRPKEAATI